jgi:hypothetical protein
VFLYFKCSLKYSPPYHIPLQFFIFTVLFPV